MEIKTKRRGTAVAHSQKPAGVLGKLRRELHRLLLLLPLGRKNKLFLTVSTDRDTFVNFSFC